jgi:hypothetical protein
MVGCYGPDKEDRIRERQLDDWLDEQAQEVCIICERLLPEELFPGGDGICDECEQDGHWVEDNVFIDAGDNAHVL